VRTPLPTELYFPDDARRWVADRLPAPHEESFDAPVVHALHQFHQALLVRGEVRFGHWLRHPFPVSAKVLDVHPSCIVGDIMARKNREIYNGRVTDMSVAQANSLRDSQMRRALTEAPNCI
jgi:hypothetical protein